MNTCLSRLVSDHSSVAQSVCCVTNSLVSVLAMGGGKCLLLLPGFLLLVTCQQKPKVTMLPDLKTIFFGDRFYLICNSDAVSVKWFLNGTEQEFRGKKLKIPAAGSKTSGLYVCESNGQKSEDFTVQAHEYTPIASLILSTGQPVMEKKGSVILTLVNDDGIGGWNCWVFRGETTKLIKLNVRNDSLSVSFQPTSLSVPETIFWCSDKTRKYRSNQITIRTTEKRVSLEMYPFPALDGDKLTLRCLVWGTNHVSNAEFFKDNSSIQSVDGSTFEIKQVKESEGGNYRCRAKFRYEDQTLQTPHILYSDDQEVLVQEQPLRAKLTEHGECSCPSCTGGMSHRFYKHNGASWTMLGSNWKPDSTGTYRCRFVMDSMRTLPSSSFDYGEPANKNQFNIVIIIIAALILVVSGIFLVIYGKRRNSSSGNNTIDAHYEEVALKTRGDEKYETLAKAKESEYDTINPEASGEQRKGGEYEALKKEGMQEGVYHSLQAHGGDEGYEALKKEGMQEGVYHSVQVHGAAGGDGGYEALKREGIKGDDYQTLET
ncbi:uncharacterized protein ACNS7B_022069 [Menidia menidia]